MEQNTAIVNANADLREFTGTDNWYRHRFTGKLFTDGINHLRDAYQCYWLVDDILFFATQVTEPFQVWKLERVMQIEDGKVTNRTDRFKLTCDDGNSRVVFSSEYSFSDFSADTLKLYLCDNVLMLPSEY